MRCRVVCGRGVTMLTFCPTRALSNVDLPTFGRPTRAAKPLWKSGRGVSDKKAASSCLRAAVNSLSECAETRRSGRLQSDAGTQLQQDLAGGFLLGTAAARAAPLTAALEVGHVAGHVKGLRVSFALDALN